MSAATAIERRWGIQTRKVHGRKATNGQRGAPVREKEAQPVAKITKADTQAKGGSEFDGQEQK